MEHIVLLTQQHRKKTELYRCTSSFIRIFLQFVPRLITEVFGQWMKLLTTIQVIGKNWPVNYDVRRGNLRRLTDMLKYFKVESKETLVFKLDVSNIISARIYQKNGKEIDYVTRMFGNPSITRLRWIWNLVWNDDGK